MQVQGATARDRGHSDRPAGPSGLSLPASGPELWHRKRRCYRYFHLGSGENKHLDKALVQAIFFEVT